MKITSLLIGFVARNVLGLSVAGLLGAVGMRWRLTKHEPVALLKGALTVLSSFWILVLMVLFMNHIRFPLFLDLMEGTVFQHFQHAASFQHIYPEPSPEYIPLAYNVFYYIVAVPFSWVFGETLSTLRLIAILATVGIGFLVFWILRRETGSRWWGLLGAGLFAASYFVMDSYLDTAHSDSSFVLCSIAGSALIQYRRSRGIRLLGLGILIASFWFKQHGALFAIGGVLFLTWDEGWRRSWPYWLLAAVFGPAFYLGLGPPLFGSHFTYFTYGVPAGWSTISLHAVLRFGGFFVIYYFWLSLAAGGWFTKRLKEGWRQISIWQVQLLAALGTALLGSLDPGSSNNVYIPFATWIILTGMMGLNSLDEAVAESKYSAMPYILMILSFSLIAYNPVQAMRPWRADQTYHEFVQFLGTLDGTVYAPTLGQLPKDYTFYPAAHWVALEDMVRGPQKKTRNHPLIQKFLASLLDSDQPRYILANYPLTRFPWFEYLNDHFVLEQDLQDRFRALEVLPGRNSHGWPRYLYRLETSSPAIPDSGG